MNIKFILVALVFFLIPELSENLLFDDFMVMSSSKTKENSDNRWLVEEEREAKTVSSSFEDKIAETGSSSGGNAAAFLKAEQGLLKLPGFETYCLAVFHRIILHKNPKYIQYCNLKLDC